MRGAGDPTHRVAADGSFWRACVTPLGPATLHLRVAGDEVVVSAWGDGARWAVDSAPALLGATTTTAGSRPTTPCCASAGADVRAGGCRARAW